MKGRLAFALLLASCGGEAMTTPIVAGTDASAPGTDAGIAPDAQPPAPEDLTERLFPANRLIDVAITLPAADWDALRNQPRFAFEDLVGPMCLTDPFESPFTWFRATITIDGRTYSN